MVPRTRLDPSSNLDLGTASGFHRGTDFLPVIESRVSRDLFSRIPAYAGMTRKGPWISSRSQAPPMNEVNFSCLRGSLRFITRQGGVKVQNCGPIVGAYCTISLEGETASSEKNT